MLHLIGDLFERRRIFVIKGDRRLVWPLAK